MQTKEFARHLTSGTDARCNVISPHDFFRLTSFRSCSHLLRCSVSDSHRVLHFLHIYCSLLLQFFLQSRFDTRPTAACQTQTPQCHRWYHFEHLREDWGLLNYEQFISMPREEKDETMDSKAWACLKFAHPSFSFGLHGVFPGCYFRLIPCISAAQTTPQMHTSFMDT